MYSIAPSRTQAFSIDSSLSATGMTTNRSAPSAAAAAGTAGDTDVAVRPRQRK